MTIKVRDFTATIYEIAHDKDRAVDDRMARIDQQLSTIVAMTVDQVMFSMDSDLQRDIMACIGKATKSASEGIATQAKDACRKRR